MLKVKLLGQVEILQGARLVQGFRSQKELALFIYLGHTGQLHTRLALADLLWQSSSSKQALSNIRTVLTRLQKILGDIIISTQKSLVLNPELQIQFDSVQLLQILQAVQQIDTAEQAQRIQAALDLYQGDFLAGFQLRDAPFFDDWMYSTREYIRSQVISGYRLLTQYAAKSQDFVWTSALARRWLTIDPLDEDAHQSLIQSLLQQGYRRGAQAQYQQYVQILEQELGVEPSEEITALIQSEQTNQLPSKITPPVNPLSIAQHNIPAPYDQFIGRESVLQQSHERLDQTWNRLVTIIGPGGIGKTRLATTIARQRLDKYSDGVWFIELVDIDADDEDLSESLAVEIATVLDLRFTGSASPKVQLLKHLQYKNLLLVLDNFEHIIPAFKLLLDISQQCEQIQILVTSREPLNLRIESIISLAGLTYPTDDNDNSVHDAVSLFFTRAAQRHSPQFDQHDLLAIRQICRLVEGLPLAIELAAMLTGTLKPQQIVEHLHNGFELLSSTLRDIPQRHSSLQIVFHMSWRLLSPALQQSLALLTVFRGGFTAEAALQITATNHHDLIALLDKSLLQRQPARDRYSLHPIVRAYAAEQLAHSDQNQQAHAHFYLALLAQHSDRLQRNRPQDSIELLEPDIDNLRLAWHTGLHLQAADRLLPALSSFSCYYQLRGLAQEGEAVMQATVNNATKWGTLGQQLAVRAGLEQARFLNRLGRYRPAISALQSALRLNVYTADQWAEAMAHILWGESLWRLGEHDSARAKLRHAFSIGTSINSAFIIGWSHHHLGVIDDIQGRYDQAYQHLQQACSAWRSIDNANTLSASLTSLGLVCLHQGNYQNAQEFMEQALTLCTELDNRHMRSLLLSNLSMMMTEKGDHSTAQYYLEYGLDLAVMSGNLEDQCQVYTNLGRNYYVQDQFHLAAEFLEQGLQLAETLGNRSLIAWVMLNLSRVKRQLGEEQQGISLCTVALQITQHDQLAPIECELLLEMAECLHETDRAKAQNYSTQAVTLAQNLKDTQLLERANQLAYYLHLPSELARLSRSA